MKYLKYIWPLLLIPCMVFAEGGSAYSRIGVGDLFYSFSARRLGMGELGTAVFDRDYLSNLNPASWSRLNMTRFETGLNFQDIHVKDESRSAYSALASFSGFMLGVPIERDLGISIVGGITPYSSVNYNISQTNNDATYPNTVSYEGKGSLSKAFIGASYKLPGDINIGAELDYYIGNSNYYSRITFNNDNFTNSEYTKTHKISGLGGNFGIISNDFAQLLGMSSITNLRLGAALSLKSSFNSDSSLVMTTVNGTQQLAQSKTIADIPMRFAAGMNFIYKNSYLFSFDYLYQPWSEYTFNNMTEPNLRNLQKVSAGLEYRSSDMRSAGFWEKILLRAGLSYEQSQYQLNGQGINQYSVYGGFSVPLEYENYIDIGLQYSTRGTTESNLVREDTFRLNVSVSLGELWFLRSER